MTTVPTVKLNNGLDMPLFGLGTWKSEPGKVAQAVKDAIDAGYRYIDCAHAYQNEAEVGSAIKAKIDDGTVKREDLFIVSKLWNTFHRPDLVVPALKTTLKNLGLDSLDIYLIHWPMAYKEEGELFPKDSNDKIIYSDVDYLDTWKAMEECVTLGLTKSIGLSNFNSEQINRILTEGTIKPVNLQVECHPYLNQDSLFKFCKSKDIVMTGYSPLGSPDRPWAKPTDPKLLEDEKLVELAKKAGKTPAQVALRWNVQRGIVTIPKSVTKARIEENINIFDFTLSEDEMETLNGFNCGGRCLHLEWVKDHKYYPFSIPY